MKLDISTILYILIGIIALISKLYQNKNKQEDHTPTPPTNDNQNEWGLPNFEDIFTEKNQVPKPAVQTINQEQKTDILDTIDDALDKPIPAANRYDMDRYKEALQRLADQPSSLDEIKRSEIHAFDEITIENHVNLICVKL